MYPFWQIIPSTILELINYNQRMENENIKLKPIQFIRELGNHRSEQEIQEAEYNFREYLLVIKEISDRLAGEGKTLADIVDLN
jgi:hypothetical protein